jgi:hypothetical protein
LFGPSKSPEVVKIDDKKEVVPCLNQAAAFFKYGQISVDRSIENHNGLDDRQVFQNETIYAFQCFAVQHETPVWLGCKLR